jgi:hypothetical protein
MGLADRKQDIVGWALAHQFLDRKQNGKKD